MKNGQDNYRRFRIAPDSVDAAIHFRSPALADGGRRFDTASANAPHQKPPCLGLEMSLGVVSGGVMLAMISDPACGMTGSVEYRPEDQHLLDEAIGLQSFVREHAMVTDGRSEPAKSNKKARLAQVL